MSITVKEHVALHRMSREIKASPTLARDFAVLDPAAFRASLADIDDGRALQALIDDFLAGSGHRGHADRDIYYPRYADDPVILHRALEAHLKSDVDPVLREERVNARRIEVQADVEAAIRRKPLGGLRVEVFRLALDYVLKFQQYRDDERHFIDRSTYSLRRAFLEVNRRLCERGLLKTDRDFWFLTYNELFELLLATPNRTLVEAKVRGRMRNFDRLREREWAPPKFLARDREVTFDEDIIGSSADGALQGVPTSRGQVTATARVITDLARSGA